MAGTSYGDVENAEEIHMGQPTRIRRGTRLEQETQGNMARTKSWGRVEDVELPLKASESQAVVPHVASNPSNRDAEAGRSL